MDEKKATKILTAMLVKHFGSQVIQDDFYKEKLIKDAKYFFQFDDPFIIGFDKFYMKEEDSEGRHYRWGFVGKERTEKENHNVYGTIKNAIDAEGKYEDANYFFIDKPEGNKDKGVNFFVTPHSVIGKKEIQTLQKLFYKDVCPEIISAMHVLDIENYVDLYKFYYTGGLDSKFLDNYSIYQKLVKSLDGVFWGICNNLAKQKFEEFVGSSIDNLKAKLYDNVTHDFSPEGCNDVYKDSVKNIITDLEKHSPISKYRILPLGFLDFIFTIPYVDQNIETNKEILKRYSKHINYMEILTKEYTSGGHFQEYFNCLDFEKQEKLVDSLKTLSERKPINDSFLWANGFKELKLDHLELYKNNTKDFIDYFNNRNLEEKKVILKDIMNYDFANEEIIKWLNDTHLDLIREVGFNE